MALFNDFHGNLKKQFHNRDTWIKLKKHILLDHLAMRPNTPVDLMIIQTFHLVIIRIRLSHQMHRKGLVLYFLPRLWTIVYDYKQQKNSFVYL